MKYITMLLVFLVGCSNASNEKELELISAIYLKDYQKAKTALDGIANVNYVNSLGETPLSIASYHFPNSLLIKDLVRRGANPNVNDQYGWSVLERVMAEDDYDLGSWLMKNGANASIEFSDNKIYPLAIYVGKNATNKADLQIFKSSGGDICLQARRDPKNALLSSIINRNKEIYPVLVGYIDQCGWDVDEILEKVYRTREFFYLDNFPKRYSLELNDNLASTIYLLDAQQALKTIRKIRDISVELFGGKNLFTDLVLMKKCDLFRAMYREGIDVCEEDSKGRNACMLDEYCSLKVNEIIEKE